MQVNLRLGGSAVLALAVVALAGWIAYDKLVQPLRSQVTTTVVAPEVPVVMRTTGGLLEVATVRAFERFTRADTKAFWGIPLGTTVSQIQVPVTYRFHIPMAREWELRISGKVCIVRAADLAPSLPVAFDTAEMRKQTQSGWARFDKQENLAALERSLTPELAGRAGQPPYRQLAREAARQTVAEFVTIWLLKEQAWRRDPAYQVIVLFPGEALPPDGRL